MIASYVDGAELGASDAAGCTDIGKKTMGSGAEVRSE